MRGYDQFNFPAFDAAKVYLKTYCHFDPVSPADMDRTQKGFDPTAPDFDPQTGYDFDVADALRRDFDEISRCDGIVFLNGWEASTGANAERMLGQALDLKAWIYDQDEVNGYRVHTITWEELEARYLQHKIGKSFEEQTGGHPDDAPRILEDPDTGAKKQMKLDRFDLVPAEPLRLLARHYGLGSLKYEDRNWEKGYPWSWAYRALMGHVNAWWQGEDIDPETGSPHMAAVAWHAFAIMEFAHRQTGKDDRPWKD